MKTLLKAVITALITSSMIAPAAADIGEASPSRLYGKWSWTYSKNNCTEVYDFRIDNTMQVTSGDEIAESRFTISDKPDANGFYKITDTVTKSNGRTGCDGHPGGTPIGDVAAGYIFFHSIKAEMIMCFEPNFHTCFGPLKRVVE